MPTLVVRAPSKHLIDGQITHIAKPTSLSYETAVKEWGAYISAFEKEGWSLAYLPALDSCPDCVFIEDALVIFGDTALVASPGTVSREPEIAQVERFLEDRKGIERPNVKRIVKPGTLDGGDVLKVGKDVYVGSGGRTNGQGISQLREIVAPLGYTVHPVPVTKALHLKSAVTALPDGTIIGYEPIVDDPRIFPRFMPVPEEHGVAVVVLSQSRLLMSSDAPKTKELLERLGYEVITVGISQFEALEGCVTCLSVRIRGD